MNNFIASASNCHNPLSYENKKIFQFRLKQNKTKLTSLLEES